MKFQVVLSTGGIFENIFHAALQYIPSKLIRVYLKTSVYQVPMILVLLDTENAEGKFWIKIYLPYQR